MRRFFIPLISTPTAVATLMLVGFSAAALTGCRSGSAEVHFLDRGKELLAKKEYDRAILEFKNATRVQAKDAEPYYQLGLVYLALGEFQTAYQSLLKATEIDPKHVKAQQKIAEVIASSVSNTRDPQQLQEAEKRVRSVLAIVPDSPEALSALGLTEYSLGKPEEAVKHLEAALEKSPHYLKAASGLALIRMRNKDFPGAEEILKKSAADSPRSAAAQLALGRFYLLTGRTVEAEGVYHKALMIDPKFGPALLDLARIQVISGKPDEAEKTLAALSALPDRNYRAYHANYLLDQGKVDAALREFQQHVAADPKDRDAFTRLTSAYFVAKKFPEAEQAINAALKRNPKDTSALLERSKLYLVTAKFSEAETDLNQVLRADPNSAIAYYLLSKVFVARGQQLTARQQLGKALDFNPSLLAARLELAQSLTASGAAKGALELLDQTPESQKGTLPVIVARNWAYFGTGDHAELGKSIAGGLTKYKGDRDLVLQDGLQKFHAKDIPGARKSFEQVLTARPDDTMALDALAKTFVFQKQPEVALRTVQEYAARLPNSAPLQHLLGDWFAMNKRRDDARKAYRAALAVDPSMIRARMSLALEDAAESRFDSARETLALLVNTAPPFARAEVEATFGMLEEKAGKPAAAIPHYRKALDADPNNVIALNNLASRLVSDTDQIDEALKYAQRAKELDPDNVVIEGSIGWVFYRKGLYDSAVVHLRNAVEKAPTALRKYHLAMAYFRTGDRPNGRQMFEAARRMDPSLPEAAVTSQLMDSLNRTN